MRVIIQPDYQNASRWAAHYVARQILDFQPGPKKPFVLGLPTGSSPIGMYNELAAMNKAGKLSFKNVITFNMDEYVGLPQEHPESYYSFMWTHLFGRIDIPKENVNILNGNAPDLDAECAGYEERIREAGGVRLFVGGIGPDGHIAFNEPGSSLTSRTRMVALTTDTKIANSRFFDNDPTKVPQTALSVGVGTVMDSDEVLIIVNGANKARAPASRHRGRRQSHVDGQRPADAPQGHHRLRRGCDARVEGRHGTLLQGRGGRQPRCGDAPEMKRSI
jgi:glucosamine-6-phosphate deaminase